MRNLLLYLFLIFALACGSAATDVGNPTDYIVEGTIVIDDSENSISKNIYYIDLEKDFEGINLENLEVRAIDENSLSLTSSVGSDGYFKLTLPINNTYSMYVYEGEEELAGFSFEQNDAGERENRLEIDAAGEVDMGSVRFEDGGFRPEDEEREPRRHGANKEGDRDGIGGDSYPGKDSLDYREEEAFEDEN